LQLVQQLLQLFRATVATAAPWKTKHEIEITHQKQPYLKKQPYQNMC